MYSTSLYYTLDGTEFWWFLAYLIHRMSGVKGYKSWQWCECPRKLQTELPTDFPSTGFHTGRAPYSEQLIFLSDEERVILLAKLNVDRGS